MTTNRPVPVGWKPAPLDMQMLGFKGMVVLHLPVRREWNEHRRAQVAERAVRAALEAIIAEEKAI